MTISPSKPEIQSTNSSLARILWLIFFLVLLIPSGSTKAQTDQNSEVQLTEVIGLDSYCLYDQWIPVRVTLENSGGVDLDGRVEVNTVNGFNQWSFSQPVTLPAVSRKEVTIFAYLNGSPNSFSVSFLTDKEVIIQKLHTLNCLQSGSDLIGVWASTPSVYNLLTTLNFVGSRAFVAELELADFPTHPEGLNMLSVIVISDQDTGVLSEKQRLALSSWMENGGRLMVVGGPNWQKTTAGLANLLPIRLSGTLTLPGLDELNWLTPDEEMAPAETVVSTGEVLPGATILASQGAHPLVIRQKVGFGDIYFMAADPALAPLRNWTGMEQLYQYMFATQLDIPSWARGFTNWQEASSAVSNIPGLGLPSIFLICGFLGLYIVALGPLNYVVLRRLKKRELAWFTIPMLVVVFSCAAFVMGLAVRGTRSVVNHLSIVQVWQDREQAQVHGLVGVFSPNRSQYTVQVNGNFLTFPVINYSLGSSQAWDISQSEDTNSVENLRIDAGGIEGLAVEGTVEAPDISSNLTMDFKSTGLTIQGNVQNNSNLTLNDTVLLAPGKSQNLGKFSPGDSLNIQLSLAANNSASTPNSSTTGFPNYSYGYDSTLQDIFGITYVGSSSDQDLVRKFNLLEAALGYNGTRGGGLYLVGFTDTSPLDVTLGNKGFKAEHTSIYIIALNPDIQNDASILTLPPAMFTWDRLENSTNLDFTPYNSYLYSGTYQIRYRLNQTIPYANVQSLTLHLTDYGAQGPHRLNLALWDFELDDWILLDITDWGHWDIPEPSRFVGFGGEIRVQMENPNQSSIDFERADFTLVVER